MDLYDGNRFPPNNCNRNFQWNQCDMNRAGNDHCMPPFQIPPATTFRMQQPEGFTQSNVQIRPTISNFPDSMHPPGFRFTPPSQNQIFSMNVSTASQNFLRTPDSQNFHGAPDRQNVERNLSSQDCLRAPDSQNFSRVPYSQNFSTPSNSHNFPAPQNSHSFPASQNSHNFPAPSNSHNFPTPPNSQHFTTPANSQNFSTPPNSQNFPTLPNSQDLQNFPSTPYPQNFQRAHDPQSFPRAYNPQSFPRALNPQNFPRAPNPQNFSSVPDPQNFPRAPDSQNFSTIPNSQNFSKPPGVQNFPEAHISQNFSRAPDSHFLRRGHGTQNFPVTPGLQNFPGSQHSSGAHGSQNLKRAHNIQKFRRTPSPQNFHGAPDLQHSPSAPGSRSFSRSPGSQNFPRSSGPQNFQRSTDFQNFSRAPGSFQRPYRPWNCNSSFGGERHQFQGRTQGSASSQQFGHFSSQENKRGIPKNRNFQKLKQEDSREKPFSCDTCDRAFVTEKELKDHISEHIKCNHANCTFEAHYKIVALHKKMQHDTGYADRINKLKDDAEIQKWREERKRRFPTAETVKKRKAEQAEREARGEVLETKEFGKFKRKREDSGNAMNRNDYKKRGRRCRKFNDRRRNYAPRLQPFEMTVDSGSDSDSDSHITLHRFSGMLSLTNSAEKTTDEIEEIKSASGPEIDQTHITDEHQLSQNSSKQNLSEFDSNFSPSTVPYSDSNSSNLDKDKEAFKSNDDKCNDSDDEGPVAVPIEKSLTLDQDFNENIGDVNKSVCEIPMEKFEEKNVDLVDVADSDEDGPTVVPFMKSQEISPLVEKNLDQNKDNSKKLPESDTQTKTSENGHNRNNRNNNGYNRNSRNRYSQPNGQDCIQIARKSSLLEKLLADDIRHERNVILQCIRHIVKNNFFGIENKSLK